MAGAGGKRIAKELADITTSPPAGMAISLADESNFHEWKIVLDGPAGSPYEKGKFNLLLVLPKEYPFKPPKLNFKTRIFHPNISNDEHGSMCLGMLKGDQWKPSSKIQGILESAQQLLVEPVPDDAVDTGAAELYTKDREEFNKKAAEMTKQHAC